MLIRFLRLTIACLGLLSLVNTKAQTPYFLKFSTDDGLSSNIIYSVFQDKDGYLWLSTDKGVCRYDGNSFKQFNLNDGLADNEVIRIQQDKKGRIWFLTLIGKLSFYYDGNFYNKRNSSFLAKIPEVKGYLNYFAEDENSIYFGASSNVVYRLGNDSSFEKLTHKPKGISGLWEYNGKVKGLMDRGIVTREGNAWKTKETVNLPETFTNSKTRAFAYNDKLILSSGNVIWAYDQNSQTVILDFQFDDPELDIIACFFDSKEKLWVGTRSGVYLAENLKAASEGKWERFIENCLITCIYEDREQNIWISTMGKALFYLPHSNISWIHQPYQEASNQITTTLFVDRYKRLWSGHDNSTFIIHENNTEHIHNLGKPTNLERISKIKTIGSAIWVIGKSKIRVIKEKDTIDMPYFGNDVLLDQQNRIWIASNYIYRVPEEQMDSLIQSDQPKAIRSLAASTVLSKRGNVLYEDPNGVIWLGMFEGLHYFDGEKLINLAQDNPKLGGKINDLVCLPASSHLLIASDNYGLLVLDINTKKLIQPKNLPSIGNISCASITLTRDACWLGTNSGILYLNLKNDEAPIHYSDLLGLKNLHVLDLVQGDNKLYAASSNGLLEFDNIPPTGIFKQACPVFITHVTQREKQLSPTQTWELGYHENEISIGFKGISFKERGSLSFKYKIIGLDNTFQFTNNQEVVLKALPPGKYNFIVYAVNKAGIESLEPATFSFSIKKPYWQTAWFIGAALLLLIGLSVSAWRIRFAFIRRGYELENARLDEEKKRLVLESELSDLEQHALRLQMNPHFIFNALNSIKGYYAEKKVAEADEYLSKFSKILRHILENNKRYSSLEDELEILHQYLEMGQMRHPNMFDYTIEVDEQMHTNEIMIPSLLLQPFVENAIMHGIAPSAGKGFILIKCILKEDMLVCQIRDNGIGYSISKNRRKENEHQSMAIEITKKRLEYITEQEGVACGFEIEDDIEGHRIIGTLVTLTIPANKLW